MNNYFLKDELTILLEYLLEAPKPPEDKSKKEPDAEPGKPGGDTNPFDAGDKSGESDNPFAPGGETADAGMAGGGGGIGGLGGDAAPGADGGTDTGKPEDKITFYNDKLNTQKIIKNQKLEPEPGFDFKAGENKFFDENYLAKSKDGSLLIATPKIQDLSHADENDVNFIQNVVLKKIDETILNALKNKKRVVMLGDFGLPFFEGTCEADEQGLIAKYLNKKYKDGYVMYDAWIPADYYSFIANTKIWSELKQRTEAKNLDVKSAIYLYLEVTGRDKKMAAKLKTLAVKDKLSEWGMQTDDIKTYAKAVFPEAYGGEQTLASLIIKTYIQLLKVNLIKKVMSYEKKNTVVIVAVDKNTAWALKHSFETTHDMVKEPAPETPPAPEKKKTPAEPQAQPEKPQASAPQPAAPAQPKQKMK